MTELFGFADFGIEDAFWSDVTLVEPMDDGDEKAIEMRVKFKRRTDGMLEKVQQHVSDNLDALMAETDKTLNSALEAIESGDAHDDDKAAARLKVHSTHRADREKRIVEVQRDALTLFISNWELKTVTGKSIEFDNPDHRAALFSMFPNAVITLREKWAVVTSRAEQEKN